MRRVALALSPFLTCYLPLIFTRQYLVMFVRKKTTENKIATIKNQNANESYGPFDAYVVVALLSIGEYGAAFAVYNGVVFVEVGVDDASVVCRVVIAQGEIAERVQRCVTDGRGGVICSLITKRND